tara:strand:- start:637 stop:2058 length:1422 start_codon:yes stop_codon:yes gene_type:complete
MNHKSILFFLGLYSSFVSFFSVLNILYSIYFDFQIDLNSYLLTFLISIFIGILFYYLGRNYNKDISLIDQITFIVLSFILIPFLLAIPYFLSIYNFGFLDSYFESVSGFTNTGFTIIERVKNIDEPLILWRSSSQWLGGLLFLLITIGTIGSKQVKIKPAYLISGGASGKNFYKNFNYNFIKISSIYFITTLFIIFLYNLVDIRLFDALNLSLTTVSAGGFIPVDDLSNIITSDLQTIILSLSLLFPIFNFFLLQDLVMKQFSFRKYQEDLHLALLMIFLSLFFYFFIIPDAGFSNVILAVTSSISTSGITIYTGQFDASLFFTILTIVGGSLISTSSGFKYTRIYILLKISYQEIYRLVKPINIPDKNLFTSESKIEDQDVKTAFLVFISFIISLFVLSSILTFDNLSFESSFKLSVLTLTNTVNSSLYGLENVTFFDLKSITKSSLIVFMILGKIEIIAVIYIIKRLIFRE